MRQALFLLLAGLARTRHAPLRADIIAVGAR